MNSLAYVRRNAAAMSGAPKATAAARRRSKYILVRYPLAPCGPNAPGGFRMGDFFNWLFDSSLGCSAGASAEGVGFISTFCSGMVVFVSGFVLFVRTTSKNNTVPSTVKTILFKATRNYY